MPWALKAVLAILVLHALGHLSIAVLGIVNHPTSLGMPAFMASIAAVEVLFLWGLARGKDGVRGLAAALAALGGAGQALMGVAAVHHAMSAYAQPDDIVTGIGLFIAGALSFFTTFALTRRSVKQWMVAKTLPGADLEVLGP
ncbi:MAG: hypothetical protein HOV80_14515 [Polyangiaceae bacterium]|nr:hypothetical protein [Polyangiaceae bacterium]